MKVGSRSWNEGGSRKVSVISNRAARGSMKLLQMKLLIRVPRALADILHGESNEVFLMFSTMTRAYDFLSRLFWNVQSTIYSAVAIHIVKRTNLDQVTLMKFRFACTTSSWELRKLLRRKKKKKNRNFLAVSKVFWTKVSFSSIGVHRVEEDNKNQLCEIRPVSIQGRSPFPN